jgi:hypothetical protein
MKTISSVRSKWLDGVLAILIILVLMFLLIVLIKPFALMGIPGYGIYAALCLGFSIFTLLRAIDEKRNELARAWYGLAGGMLAWTASEMASLMGGISVEHYDGALFFLIVIAPLVVLAVRKMLPGGVLFYFVVFYANWGLHLLLMVPRHFAETMPALAVVEKINVGLAVIGIIGGIYWIFARSKTRVERLWCALWVWGCVGVILYTIRG